MACLVKPFFYPRIAPTTYSYAFVCIWKGNDQSDPFKNGAWVRAYLISLKPFSHAAIQKNSSSFLSRVYKADAI